LNNLLAKSQNLTEGEIAGIKIVQNAIRIPLMKICENAGF
jgi:chaperonin GroEL (HSP60 family)